MRAVVCMLAVAVAAVSSGCSGGDSDSPGSLRPNPLEPPVPQYDYGPELNDRRTRCVSQDISWYYDDGGVLVAMEPAQVEFVNLQGGVHHRVVIKSDTAFVYGPVKSAALYVDGESCNLKYMSVERITDSEIFFNILTADDVRMVAVVTDL